MRYFAVALLFALPAWAQAQNCLVEKTGCTICVHPDLTTTASCDGGEPGGAARPDFPASLLEAPPLAEPGTLHRLLDERLRLAWVAGGTIPTLYRDNRRTFAPKALYGIVRANLDVVGSGGEWLEATEVDLLAHAQACLGQARVIHVGTTDGMGRLDLTGLAGPACSSMELAWLLRHISAALPGTGLGQITQQQLSPFREPEGLAAVVDDEHLELIASLAAAVRELGEGGLEELAFALAEPVDSESEGFK